MSIEGLDEFDKLMNDLDSLGKVGEKISSQAFRGALKNASKIIKAEAPKDTGKGRKFIKPYKVKRYKSGSQWGSIGIDSKNWEAGKHLYYQNYGYQRGNTRVTKYIGWFDRAIEKARPQVEGDLYKLASEAVDKIIK